MAKADPKSRKPKSTSSTQGHLSLVVGKTRQQYAAEIHHLAEDVVERQLEIGRLLLDAREGPGKLPHGEFLAMIKEDLRFSFNRFTAYKLMAIAANRVLSNVSHAKHLPPSWDTRYQLSLLADEVIEEKIADGTINPAIERKAVQALKLQYLPPPKPRKPRAAPNPEPGDDKEQERLRGFFGPLGAGVVKAKQVIFDTLQEIPAAERAVFFTALRQQLDELEQDFPVESQQ
jgi:hypothetical protein